MLWVYKTIHESPYIIDAFETFQWKLEIRSQRNKNNGDATSSIKISLKGTVSVNPKVISKSFVMQKFESHIFVQLLKSLCNFWRGVRLLRLMSCGDHDSRFASRTKRHGSKP